jgi:conjugal transfer mating pair stabilization protein TraN
MTAMQPARSTLRRWLSALALAPAFGVICAAASPAHAADCVKNSEICVEGPATRNIGGYPVYRDCWRTSSQFSCISQNTTDDCQPLRDRGCSQVGSSCVETNPQGACMVYEQTWQCRIASGTTSTVTNCGGQQFCIDGRCFDTSHAPDADFARAIAGLEVQREAGKYLDPNTLVVFQGYDNRCRKKLFGLVNCCKRGGSDGSLFSTMSLIAGAGGQAIGAVGSSYTYDALFASDAPGFVIQGFEGPVRRGRRLLGIGRSDGRRPVRRQLHRNPDPRPMVNCHAGHPALGTAVLRTGRTDPGHEKRQPPVPQRGQLLLHQSPDPGHLHPDHADLLLLQLQARTHPQ